MLSSHAILPQNSFYILDYFIFMKSAYPIKLGV